jgi:hypothetical protein
VGAATSEAEATTCVYLGTEHLLLALIKSSGQSAALQQLARAFPLNDARKGVMRLIGAEL